MGQTLLGGALTPLESGPIYVNMHTHTHTHVQPLPACLLLPFLDSPS